jgi:hypothetical protein
MPDTSLTHMPDAKESVSQESLVFPFADVALARRLERAEAVAGARFVEARARLFPESGAAWIDVGGTFAMFDGPLSPVTQTFGFGLFTSPAARDLATIERFFDERSSPVFHEMSPLADPSYIVLLNERGYQPLEHTSVLFQPIPARLWEPTRNTAGHPSIHVRQIDEADRELWASTAALGWSDTVELGDLLLELGRITAHRSDTMVFLAEHEGRPIATGALAISERVALLAGASTVPDGRHRGAQLALLAARLNVASELGCDLAMMAALPGSGSQRNAERNGFRIAYTRTKWRLVP